MNTQTQTPLSSSGTLGRLGWLFLIPLLTLSLPAQASGLELTVKQSTNGCQLSWPVTTNSYIVLSATNVAGPWKPCLNHSTETAGACHMSIPASHQCEYFRLVEGYYEDFDDPNLDGWTVASVEPDAATYLTWEATNGHLRVYGTWPGTNLQRHLIFYRTNLMLADFTMTIDILGWDDGVPGDRPLVSLFGRLEPSFLNFPDVYCYGGAIGMRHDVHPYLSALVLYKSVPGHVYWSDKLFSKTDPAKDYRLYFDGVGGEFHVAVEEISSGLYPEHYDGGETNPWTDGWVGFYVNVGGTNGVFDFTLDNFLAYAHTP